MRCLALVVIPWLSFVAVETEPVASPATLPHEADNLDWFNHRIAAYEPVYATIGPHEVVNMRFQISFRFLITERLNLSYTQTSFWDLEGRSKPFTDNNYKPRAFWREDRIPRPDWLEALAVEAGVGHESNGKGGLDSRSLNIVFLRPDAKMAIGDSWYARAYPMVQGYVEKSENPDLPAYRGYVDWVGAVGHRRWGQLALWGRAGSGWDHGSIQADYTVPLGQWLGGGKSPFFQLQFFNGFGEKLLEYNQRSEWQLRAGFAIVQ